MNGDESSNEKRRVREKGSIQRAAENPGCRTEYCPDLWNLNICSVADLKGKNPENLYRQLERQTGRKHDPCLLYAFRCAVYYASAKKPNPEKLKWWNWKK